MQPLLDRFLAWVKSKGGFAHVIAGAYLGLVALYATVPAFHSLVISINAAVPPIVEQAFAAAIGIAALYTNPQKN